MSFTRRAYHISIYYQKTGTPRSETVTKQGEVFNKIHGAFLNCQTTWRLVILTFPTTGNMITSGKNRQVNDARFQNADDLHLS